MYVEKVKSKGNYYLYLRMYDGSIEIGTKKRTLFAFGRIDKALPVIKAMAHDKKEIPKELREVGLTRSVLLSWLNKNRERFYHSQ